MEWRGSGAAKRMVESSLNTEEFEQKTAKAAKDEMLFAILAILVFNK